MTLLFSLSAASHQRHHLIFNIIKLLLFNNNINGEELLVEADGRPSMKTSRLATVTRKFSFSVTVTVKIVAVEKEMGRDTNEK